MKDKRTKKELRQQWDEHVSLIQASTGVESYESAEDKVSRIERALEDIEYMVSYYFPHYATCESAEFQIDFANSVIDDPIFKGGNIWGRGLAKSVWDDLFIPIHLWMRGEPMYQVLIGQTKALAKDLLMDVQAELEHNQRLINDFGEQKIFGSWEDGNFRSKSGYIGKALGAGQSVRGLRIGAQRPNYISFDDVEDKKTIKNPARQREIVLWIEGAVLGTMDGPYRRFVMAQNGFAPEMVIKSMQERHPNWKWHKVNAYDPVTYKPTWKEKYSDTYYKEIEEDAGVLAANAEYNNDPHIEGVIFTEDQIWWDKMPKLKKMKAIVGHWDIAYAGTKTADYNAVRIWGMHKKTLWYVTSFVKQSKMRPAVEFMAQFQKDLPKGVHIYWRFESQFWNDEVQNTIDAVEADFDITLDLVKVENSGANKYDRILTISPIYQNGRIRYNDEMKSHPDTIMGMAQLFGIEPGYTSHDDAPDADEQAIKYLDFTYRQTKHEPIIEQRPQRFTY